MRLYHDSQRFTSDILDDSSDSCLTLSLSPHLPFGSPPLSARFLLRENHKINIKFISMNNFVYQYSRAKT